MSWCILCGEFAGNEDPPLVCDDCKKAFLNYKKTYFTSKLLKETTELDEKMFAEICKRIYLDEIIEDEKESLLKTPADVTVKEVRKLLEMEFRDNEWMKQQPRRLERFLDYVEKQIREGLADREE